VEDEPQGAAPFLDRPGRVPEDVDELHRLVHDAPLARVRSGEPGVVSGLIDRDVQVVPGSAPLDVAAVLISPGRGVGPRLPSASNALTAARALGLRFRSAIRAVSRCPRRPHAQTGGGA
jgi:hypothetical protein